MASENLKRDQNHVSVLGGITNDAAQEIRMVRVDPSTNAVLVSASGSGGVLTPTSGQYKTFVTVGTTNADYLVGNYIDVGDAINAAYAFLPSAGGIILVLNGSYSFTTPISFATQNKYVSLQSASGGAVVLNYTATSGTAITFNIGAASVGSGTPEVGWGINGFKLNGPGGINTSIGIYTGGTNGAENVNIKNNTIRFFNIGTQTAANCWCAVFDNNYWDTNTQHVMVSSASNSGENMRFVNCTFAEAVTVAKGVFLDHNGCASVNFINCSFDDTQLFIGTGNEAVTITGGHFENPAGGAAYNFIQIDNDANSFTNVTITGTNFYLDATTGTPAQFISNGGNLALYGVTFTRNNSGTTATNLISNVAAFGSTVAHNTRGSNTVATTFMDGSFSVGAILNLDYISSKIKSFPFILNQTSSNVTNFYNGGGIGGTFNASKGWNFGDSVSNSNAWVTTAAGTTTIASVILTGGVLNSTTQAGAIENDGTHLYFTAAAAGTRFQLDQQNTLLLASDNTWTGTNTFSTKPLIISGNQSATAWTTNGTQLSSRAASLTDTTSTGTVAAQGVNAFGIPTLLASSSTTYTVSANVYIAGAPVASTNVTQTAAYALYIAGGTSFFNGTVVGTVVQSGLQTNSTQATSTFSATNSGSGVDNTNAGVLFAAATTVRTRAFLNQTTGATPSAGSSYANFIVGSSPITAAATGTHALIANTVINPIGTITNGSAIPITNTASLYINGAGTGGTNNYALLVNNGNVALGTAGQRLLITEGSNGIVGQVALVSGTKSITISGLTTASRAFIQGVSQAGTVSTTFEYAAVCTANTLTITALTTGNVTNTLDTSTLNYFVIN